MAKANLRLVAPSTVNRTVTARRPPNSELRTREHLTADEVEQLIEAAGANRHGPRDALMVLLAYRHGLRAVQPWHTQPAFQVEKRRQKGGAQRHFHERQRPLHEC